LFGEGFGGGGVGIELEDLGDVGASFVDLTGVACDVGEVHADSAAAGGAFEGVFPQSDRTIKVAGARFNDAKVCGSVDQEGVGLKGMLVAAKILGADLSRDLSAAQVDDIRAIWMEHKIAVFRGQTLSSGDLMRFTERFGPLCVVEQRFPAQGRFARYRVVVLRKREADAHDCRAYVRRHLPP